MEEGIMHKSQGMESETFDMAGYIRDSFSLENADLKTYSPLTLAFIGDGVYDMIIRTIIVEKGNAPVNKLHQKVSRLVKASAQVEVYRAVENSLTEEELSVFKRGRNAKSFTSAKNASITDYRIATGFEALIGYLYMSGDFKRCVFLVKEAFIQLGIISF